ncbi:1-acyl-sn-glycerol-3-phosphate acyltransferase [Plesiocystis pacifica SIR-1]|uniref:1-acyl-sn-glycerol-3-phosphate acyltransferase n=1 Tax=Plesiocystis pacifica SIR-1 TaxID=391625 RepID=A6G8Z7_9BACT|nr:lysophospholipid acyltransferase family protein [Plesiocystis pacifica]EDM77683.1 1-acyl-sn-glycerol-3-phosphate acyltransferase [Plesiocystis pacifica SIR-1]
MARSNVEDRDPTWKDWARSVPAMAGMLTTMLGFEVPLRVIGNAGSTDDLMDAGHVFADVIWANFRMTGASLTVSGIEHVDPRERHIIVANHQGFSDVIVISTTLRSLQPRYVAKRELARGWPSISYLLEASGSAIIDRRQPEAAIGEIERLGRQAKREAWNVAIFPEGTRARDGVPNKWKSGGLRALLQTAGDVRVLPVSLRGGAELFAHNALPFRAGVDMGIRIHPPVSVPEVFDGPEFDAWVEEQRLTVVSGLG